jgi:hypothetical protein
VFFGQALLEQWSQPFFAVVSLFFDAFRDGVYAMGQTLILSFFVCEQS